MPRVDTVVETALSRTARVQQLEAMFDVPASQKVTLRWSGNVPIEDRPWNVGLIVGPSGSGKTSVARSLFDVDVPLEWTARSVIDDFPSDLSITTISEFCQAVGFNTIPAWLRPYSVLSNGEQFRVALARRMATSADPIVVDEFTSVVDRQVAQIGSHAVQKWARRNSRRFVAITCHYDVIDWLQPDWVLEPATMTFTWRSLQRRPTIEVTVSAVDKSLWPVFAPFHYMSAKVNGSARFYAAFVNGQPTSIAATLNRPHPTVRDIVGVSRLVTLPDWQGLGLAMVLVDALGSAFKAVGLRLHTYPAHPALIRTFQKSVAWRMKDRPGSKLYTRAYNKTSTRKGAFGGRPNAVFEYVGRALADVNQAIALLNSDQARQSAARLAAR